MNKGTTTEQIIEVARRTREHGIIPEFSFVFGDPDAPDAELENTLRFIRRLKDANPAMELISYFYTPTPQRSGTYGGIDPLSGTPTDLDEWIKPEWVDWMTHVNPQTPWLSPAARTRVADFEMVLKSRFPSVHDRSVKPWGKAMASVAARRRWERGHYDAPWLLKAIRRAAQVTPDDPQAYGHLRAAAE
jgi:hypothetical protein